MKIMQWWTVFSLGFAAGASVALLYAPRTGEKTRKQLKRNLEDAGDYLQDGTEAISKHAGRAYKTAKGVAGDVASRVSGVADKVSGLM